MTGQLLQCQKVVAIIDSGHAISLICPISISDRVRKTSTPKWDPCFLLWADFAKIAEIRQVFYARILDR
jgi:hypothetical protein